MLIQACWQNWNLLELPTCTYQPGWQEPAKGLKKTPKHKIMQKNIYPRKMYVVKAQPPAASIAPEVLIWRNSSMSFHRPVVSLLHLT